jgi:hypothetical protein
MKLSSFLAKTTCAAALSIFAGCIIVIDPPPPEVGNVQFSYIILENDGAGNVVASPDCGFVDSVVFMVGDDNNASGTLDDVEIVEQATESCNQNDDNLDGFIDEAELGLFFGINFTEGFSELFAVEFRDIGGNPIPWQTFDINTNSERFSFAGGLNIAPFNTNVIPFAGDGAQLNGELQSFFGF